MDQKVIPQERPLILRQGHYDLADVAKLRSVPGVEVYDLVAAQLDELYEVEAPAAPADGDGRKVFEVAYRAGREPELVGDWSYLPWSRTILHTLTGDNLYRLRTNRNQHLVSTAEQSRLRSGRIAVAGLSVGGGMATALVAAGIGSEFYLADFDLLSTANLNRVRARLADIGQPKAAVIARQIWDLDPHQQLRLFANGVDDDSVDAFLGDSEPVDILFEEIDDFRMKVRLRQEAKRRRIPVVMLSGLGDSVLVDVERYDLEPEAKLFHGLIPQLETEMQAGILTKEAMSRYAAQIVGVDNVPTRALGSLLEIGHTLVGRPQLGGTVLVESGLAPFIARMILLDQGLTGGRYKVDLASIHNLDDPAAMTPQRQSILKRLLPSS